MFSEGSSFDLCKGKRDLSAGFGEAIKGDLNDPKLFQLATKLFGYEIGRRNGDVWSALKSKIKKGEITQEEGESFLKKVIKDQAGFILMMRRFDESLNSTSPFSFQSIFDQWFPNMFEGEEEQAIIKELIRKEISDKIQIAQNRLEKLKTATVE